MTYNKNIHMLRALIASLPREIAEVKAMTPDDEFSQEDIDTYIASIENRIIKTREELTALLGHLNTPKGEDAHLDAHL